MMNVNSSTTTLTFTAPSLPDDMFIGTIVVMVTAVSSIGVGPASDPATAVISGMRLLYNVECLLYVCNYLHLLAECFCSLLHFLTKFDLLNLTFFKATSNHEMWFLVCMQIFLSCFTYTHS